MRTTYHHNLFFIPLAKLHVKDSSLCEHKNEVSCVCVLVWDGIECSKPEIFITCIHTHNTLCNIISTENCFP